MTVQVSSPRTARRGGRRSGAAQRAYERRTQRATVHSDSGVSVKAGTAGTGTMAARVPFVATIIGMLALGLALTLLLTTRSAEDSYELSEAREYNQSLIREKASLQRDVETANSAPRLAAEAADLGMVPAVDPARLVVHPDGSVEVIGTPAPATGTPVPPLDAPAPSGQPMTSVTTGTDRSSSESTRTSATPSPGNDTRIQAEGEQLVPVIPSDAPSVGGRQ